MLFTDTIMHNHFGCFYRLTT